MAGWQQLLAGMASNVEAQFDQLKSRLGGLLGSDDPLVVVPYLGYGTPDQLIVRGRVLQEKKIRESMDNDTLWDNLLNAYRRFESDEVPFARVRARFQGQTTEFVADDEGFFTARIVPGHSLEADRLWHQIELELLEPLREGHPPVHATGQVLAPPPSAQFGVISDIDDTVVYSHATDLLRMARIVFLGNARTRLPFPGVASFYQALQGGAPGSAQNPLFFVSSSPWNLYDLLVDFMEINDIPAGPLLLRDIGIETDRFITSSHHDHKSAQIARILDAYPDLDFVLLGDSGQHDPEIYAQIVSAYPRRIRAVYIRHVASQARGAAIEDLARRVQAEGVDLLLADDSAAAAQHAAQIGLIAPSALPIVEAAGRQARRHPYS